MLSYISLFERKIVNSASLAYGKATVIYFWSQTQMNQYRNTLNRLNKLLTFNVSNEFPMRLSYSLDENNENNKIDFYIAPKIVE